MHSSHLFYVALMAVAPLAVSVTGCNVLASQALCGLTGRPSIGRASQPKNRPLLTRYRSVFRPAGHIQSPPTPNSNPGAVHHVGERLRLVSPQERLRPKAQRVEHECTLDKTISRLRLS